MKPIKRVAVTGGGGQIAYSLLFRIAQGDLFGPDQPVALHILELDAMINVLKGVQMELEDCAFPLLQEIKIGSNPQSVFEGIDYALLVGAKPRGPGMERGDLLNDNGAIFVEQGKALNEVAEPHAKIIVVGNPCNTNCLIAMHHAPKIPRKNFHAMTRLDQNRAAGLLAHKAHKHVKEVTNMTIWGNHSATQVPDFEHAKIDGAPVPEIIKDKAWLEGDFISAVQKRGAAIIAARGKSSAASAAHAVIEAVKSLENPTNAGDWFSSAVCTDGNAYGIPDDLIFSFPLVSKGDGKYDVVNGLQWDEFLKEKIKITQRELLEERDLVRDRLKG